MDNAAQDGESLITQDKKATTAAAMKQENVRALNSIQPVDLQIPGKSP